VLPYLFSAVPGASDPVVLFCGPRLIFGGTEGVGFRFHVLRAVTNFRRYRGRKVPFSCFALPDSFSVVPRASHPVFMFSARGYVFDGTEVVGSSFHVLRSRAIFRRYRGRQVPFSCFTLVSSFSAVPRASRPSYMFSSRGHDFIFCAPRLLFGRTGGVRSRFHILCSRTRFRWYRGRQVPFSYLALPESFLAVPRASGPVFMFCAPIILFSRTGGIGSCFLMLRARTRFDGTEALGSCFLLLRSRTHFRRYRRYRVQFSCFARLDLFSSFPRASGPVFMFCASGLVFGGTGGIEYRFLILRARTRFRR
jgi:hypothetical protein